MELFISEHGRIIFSGIVSLLVIAILLTVVKVLGSLNMAGLSQLLG